MNSLKSHFKFNKQERSGIFFLLLLIIAFQVTYYLLKNTPFERFTNPLNTEVQMVLDSLKSQKVDQDSLTIYPFNPNFIADFKGYSLGMSVKEIDRLLHFRSTNKFVTSPEEFQKVTLISDSLLAVISPFFRFPEFTQNRTKQGSGNEMEYKTNPSNSSTKEAFMDLNSATAQELTIINGIGETLSLRIIRFRDRLGGFLVEDQLQDVYGLEPEVVKRTLAKFRILNKPVIQKININSANKDELGTLVYLSPVLAQRILDYRATVGTIRSLDELMMLEGFPSDKIDRIKLYLQL